jgi:hypothetical protein
LETKPEYEALSYVWGDTKDSEKIWICLDKQAKQQILIGKNLFASLQALRDKSKPRVLWVDALCINQDDLDERKEQVALMKYIYGDTSRLLIWLGPASVLDDDNTGVK